MNRKATAFILLTALIIVACSIKAPVETPMRTVAETLEIPITGPTAGVPATSTFPPPPEFTSAPESPRSTNSPDCTNSAVFVTDVTIPDNSEMVGDTVFTKTWRIANTGTCIWASDYSVTNYAGENMSAPTSTSLTLTYPGQTVDVSVTLRAPNTIGTHTGYFVIKNPAGLIMQINTDSRLWVVIDVKSTVTATATAIGAATNTPATASGASGNGFATANCAYTLDPTKVTDAINAVNAYRTQSGLPVYKVNLQLTLAAQSHANDIACNKLFVHTGSNGSTVESRVVVSGYVAKSVGENVYGSDPPLTGSDVVSWWNDDKTDLRNNQNLVSDKFVDIGVGYAFFNDYGYYVIVFATP